MDIKSQDGMRNVWILTISMAFISMSYTMLVPFLPVYLFQLGVDKEHVAVWSGAVFSITFLISGIMAPVWGKISDDKGKKLMAIRAGYCIGICYILTGMVSDVWQLLGARALVGFANGFMPAAMTMVSLSVEKERVGRALGIFQTGVIVGNVVGPLLGGILESLVGMRPVFYLAGATLIVVTTAVAFYVREPRVVSDGSGTGVARKTSMWEDLRIVSRDRNVVELLWLFFIMQAAILMLQPILTLYIGQIKGTMEGAAMVAGTILSVGGIAGIVTTNLWASYGQRAGYFRAIAYAIAGTGLFIFLQSISSFGIWWFAILQVFVGCCIVGVNPALSAALTLYTDPAYRGRIFGMSTTAQQFGSMTGPLFASTLTAFMGLQYVFLVTGALLFLVGYREYRVRVKGQALGNHV